MLSSARTKATRRPVVLSVAVSPAITRPAGQFVLELGSYLGHKNPALHAPRRISKNEVCDRG